MLIILSICVVQLVQKENVRGVITMNEEYETKYFCNSSEVRPAVLPEQICFHLFTGNLLDLICCNFYSLLSWWSFIQ